jgi:hypothetical protein
LIGLLYKPDEAANLREFLEAESVEIAVIQTFGKISQFYENLLT